MLADLFPKIAAEAFGWDPKLFAYASGSKQKWLCPKAGHVYEMRIASRTSQGSGKSWRKLDCSSSRSVAHNPEFVKVFEASGC